MIILASKHLWCPLRCEQEEVTKTLRCSHPGLQLDPEFYLRPLLSLNSSQIRYADKKVIDFIIPYAQFLGTRFDHEMSRFRKLAWEWYARITRENGEYELNLPKLHKHWEEFNLVQTSLCRCFEHISQFCNSKSKRSSSTAKLLQDYRALRNQIEQFEREINFFVQVEVSIRGVAEMKVSNKMAKTVRMLTILAFFFIPASFGASVFGSDLQVFDSGNVKLSTFIGTLVSLVVGTWVIAGIAIASHSGWLKNFLKRARTNRRYQSRNNGDSWNAV